jgi:rfaE bifunctional protein kinase chain/domain
MSKLVFISGNFNVLHPGHIRLIKFAKEFSGKLVIGVYCDRIAAKNAHVNERLRLESVKSIGIVDEAFLIENSLECTLEKLKPDFVIKGKEYEQKYNEEVEIINKYGGKLIFSSGEVNFSSVDLIRKEISSDSYKTIVKPLDYFKRNNIKLENLQNTIKKFESLKICVIGDLIVDEYINCEPLGMSQEDPTIVVSPLDTSKFIGGAGIVAAHAAGLGATVEFISVAGIDAAGSYAKETLSNFNVSSTLIIDETRPTTLKQRFRSKGKTLLRVSHLHQASVSLEIQEKIFEIINEKIGIIDLIVFSDFNYGVLPQKLVDRITNLALVNKVPLVADSQSSSQIGDIGRFKNMNLITPTEREARIATRNQEDGLIVLSEKLKKITNAKNILLKLGEDGVLVDSSNDLTDEWHTDQVGALNLSPKDVAGAGDSMLITSALSLVVGANIWESAFLGSLAAAIQVSRIGNKPLQTYELLDELES